MAKELVHARYEGETEVVMPELAQRERCCQPENKGGGNPAVLHKGDVILLDPHSAEGRADFSIVRAKKSAASKKEA